MNVDFINIADYLKNRESNIFIKMFLYSVIISFLLIWIVIVSSYSQKEVYYENNLIIDNYEVFLICDYSNLSMILNNQKIIINKKSYYYVVDMVTLDNDTNYKVKILVDLEKFYFSQNVFEYKILIKEENILSYFVRTIKGG